MENDPDLRTEITQLRAQMQQLQKISTENNFILRRIRFWGRISFWAKVLIWGLVLIAPLIIYSYIAPFTKVLPGGTSSSTDATGTSLFGIPSPTELVKSVQNK
jgi:hypothetical protein